MCAYIHMHKHMQKCLLIPSNHSILFITLRHRIVMEAQATNRSTQEAETTGLLQVGSHARLGYRINARVFV